MDVKCRMARFALRTATRKEYEELVHEAKLTPFQSELVQRHIVNDESIAKIAIELHSSEQRVKRQLHKAYLAVSQIRHFP